MGFSLLVRRTLMGDPVAVLLNADLPQQLRVGLERWVGAAWQEWLSPPGRPADAAFKRSLWRRVRDERRGG